MSSQTRPELENIRVQDVYPYIQNTPGESLGSVLYTIDQMLKEASPDAMAPGLINWGSKNLFVNKWITDSGTADLNYNEFGQSKIGKGRYEVSGTGRIYYDRFLAISDIRGVTGRIYLGSTMGGASVSVGVLCYDANKNFLGTNGGFIADTVEPPINDWSFHKSSCFGEGTSDQRRLMPGTRFVRLYIDIANNPNSIYFDESELTTFEVDERYLEINTNIVDWNRAEMFQTFLSGNQFFEFRNTLDGKVKTLAVTNISGSDIEVTFPSGMKWQGGEPTVPLIVRSQKTSIFSFLQMNNTLYASVIEEME